MDFTKELLAFKYFKMSQGKNSKIKLF